MDNFDKTVKSSARLCACARYTHAPPCARGVPIASVRWRKRRGAMWRHSTPPTQLKIYIFYGSWLSVCVCAGAFQYFSNKAESHRHTSNTRRADAAWTALSFWILNYFSWRSLVGVDLEVGVCVCSSCVGFFCELVSLTKAARFNRLDPARQKRQVFSFKPGK